MKKMLIVVCSLFLLITMFGCKQKEKDHFTIGICQLVVHDALDAATKGFKDAIIEKLGQDKVTFDYQNAAGDSATCISIANSFVSKGYDLIMANATPALQACYSATATIPILATSITEYSVALGLKDFNGIVGNNVSGTSDLAPLDKQCELIERYFSNPKQIGILFCSSEANSAYQVNVVEQYFNLKNIKVQRYSFTDSNDVSSITLKACQECDVLYIPTDNTAASCIQTISNIILENKVPMFAGEMNVAKVCGVASLSIDYYDLGYTTGLMAVDILLGNKKIEEMPIQYAPAEEYVNQQVKDLLNIK